MNGSNHSEEKSAQLTWNININISSKLCIFVNIFFFFVLEKKSEFCRSDGKLQTLRFNNEITATRLATNIKKKQNK